MKQRVLIIEEDDSRATLLVEALHEAGFDVVARFPVTKSLLARCSDVEADILVIDVDLPSEELLTQLHRLNQLRAMPMVIFADKGENEVITRAIKAGVSAFVVDGMSLGRIKSIITVALARFAENQSLRKELEETRASLAERKLIEKAKGIIMRQRKVDEDAAYKAMRSMAMNQNIKLHEVARNIISVSELLY